MIARILVPLDCSPLSEEALDHAAALARRTGAELRVVHVYGPVYGRPGADDPALAVLETMHGYLRAIADRLRVAGNRRVSTRLFEGSAPREIARHASDWNADLVVMTTHGRTGLARLLLGSVAEAVSHLALVPVLLLRPAGFRCAGVDPEFRHALVGVDGSAGADAALACALAITDGTRCRYTLVRVIDDLDSRDEVLHDLRDVARRAAVRDVEYAALVRPDAASMLVDFAHRTGVDLIVLGAGRHLAIRHVLGTTADRVLRAGGTAMLIHPEPLASATTAEELEEHELRAI